jgi:23S rRNA pseudouridine1911/1915/1917 synthase
MLRPQVLYEDNHLLVIDKPVGLSTQGAAPGEPSVVDWAKQYLKQKYAKPGNVYVGVVSRLDRDVSGVLVLARTSKAAARLNEQFRARTVEKTYWAIVGGTPPAELHCVDRLAADDRVGRMTVVGADDQSGQDAALTARVLESCRGVTLVEVKLETGRKHQIRVQLAARGFPVVGDRKYGSRHAFTSGIALHARRLVLGHPTRPESLEVVATCPTAWREFAFSALDRA